MNGTVVLHRPALVSKIPLERCIGRLLAGMHLIGGLRHFGADAGLLNISPIFNNKVLMRCPKNRPEKKHAEADKGTSGVSGASRDSPVGSDDNEEVRQRALSTLKSDLRLDHKLTQSYAQTHNLLRTLDTTLYILYILSYAFF